MQLAGKGVGRGEEMAPFESPHLPSLSGSHQGGGRGGDHVARPSLLPGPWSVQTGADTRPGGHKMGKEVQPCAPWQDLQLRCHSRGA